MRQAPAETLPQAQLQRRHERGDIRLRGQVRDRQQQAQRFRIELAVEIQAFHNGVVVRPPRKLAETAVFGLLLVIGGASRLHRAALAANPEAAARRLAAGEAGGAAQIVHAPEVHLPKGGAGDVLEAERRFRARQRVCGLNGFLLEVHDQMAGVEQRFAVVLLVQYPAAVVGGGGMHHAQRQHVAALAFIGPHGVAAARTGCVAVAAFLQVFAIGAARAQAPGFHRGNPRIDAGNAHMAAAGVELVVRCQLAQRRLRRAFVFVNGARFRFLVGLVPRRPVDDGAQRDALLRKGVVRNQPFVGEELERVAPVDAAADGVQCPPFGIYFLDFAFAGLVLRAFGQGGRTAAQALRFGAQGLALAVHLQQPVQQPRHQRRPAFFVALQELGEIGAGGFLKLGERLQKPLQQLVRIALNEIEEWIGEAIELGRLDVFVNRAHGGGHGVFGDAASNPAIQAERRELPFQHRGGVEENARRRHAPRQHVQRFGVIVEVVRLAGGHRHGERVAVPATGAANALRVVLRRRRHLAQHHRGKLADIHAQFQGWGGGEQVWLPRLGVRRGKSLLQPGAFVAPDQRRVFGGNDAAHGGSAVQLTEPSWPGGLRRLVAVLGGKIEAVRSPPELGFAFRHQQWPPALGAAQHGGAGGGVETRRIQAVGGGVAGVQLRDQAGLRQRREQGVEHIRRVFRGGEGIERRQHLLHPFLIPGLEAAALSSEGFQAALPAGASGRKHRQGGAPAEEILQGGVAFQRAVGIAALGNIGFGE